eukprot:CAMPEP_0116017310 /NCGR_PEP_ID=MMETSP0321-20121206/7971_1 /TAXON_ID=163516 /ORGANISM="Leptocylindrus danicus var. danicus, Strain B650" /LENGTH=434 /DNA_ID=CAMNT_0003487477 /DNA_START=390 /DNA_END=1694 /DNA_ORIENTATION=-
MDVYSEEEEYMLRQGSGSNRRSVVNRQSIAAVNRASVSLPQQAEPSRTERAKVRAHKSRKKAPELTEWEQYDPTYSLGALPAYKSGRDRDVHEDRIQTLMKAGFTRGLSRCLLGTTEAFALRIWVVDNSGSMTERDGNRVVPQGQSIVSVPCSRWEEICDTVQYHANMAATLNSPTIFRLLNDPGSRIGPQQFGIAEEGEEYINDDLRLMRSVMNKAQPGGVTPLTKHILEIQQGLHQLAPQLVSEGKRAVVILATDGLPTDEEGYGGPEITNEFMAALKSLEGLPVWVVIRLCTDEPMVTEFYNKLDDKLELSLEVLDDYAGEAHEIHVHNRWLNYGLPLHRLRELGFHDRVMDMIDERPLTKGEIAIFCSVLFGVNDLPDPAADWVGFVRVLDKIMKTEKKQWSPVKNKVIPWIDLKKLHQDHGDGSKCVIM